MVSDTVFDLCLPILVDDTISEDDKSDHLEELLKKDLHLSGKALEDAVLGVLWKHKGGAEGTSSPSAVRATIIRRPSPAPWQFSRSTTPLASSPRSVSAGLMTMGAHGLIRTKSSTGIPSPRPSPRLAYATPQIPHSPSLSAYQFSEPSPTLDHYGDLGSDNVDWLVADDASSITSYADAMSGTAAEYIQPVSVEMSPFDIMRSILQDDRSDDELNKLLEANGYDLGQTIASMMDAPAPEIVAPPTEVKSYLVGKSMSPSSRPVTPAGQVKSPIVCRYFLASGHCARADCRFSHDLTSHVCKYWMAGKCLAADSCMFSHDPSLLMSKLSFNSDQPIEESQQDFSAANLFPSLPRPTSESYTGTDSPFVGSPSAKGTSILAQSAMNPFANFVPSGLRSTPDSRPTSRQASRAATPSTLSMQDDEAFPTLGSAGKTGKRHHGKRGHGHSLVRENSSSISSSMADVVKMTPGTGSPVPALQTRRGLKGKVNVEDPSIPPPEHIPWLETGESANRAYLKARAEAFRHGALRNKFLQGAAQAWNRNDARGAKALSLRGQSENTLMREAHREAARVLYEDRNKSSAPGKELYVDLHGLHPEEAISYLTTCLLEHGDPSRPLYAICGTGHHSKNGKDKIGKAVRTHLADLACSFREFSVPGDRNNTGGIIGILSTAGPSGIAAALQMGDGGISGFVKARGSSGSEDSAVGLEGLEGRRQDSKVRIVKA